MVMCSIENVTDTSKVVICNAAHTAETSKYIKIILLAIPLS